MTDRIVNRMLRRAKAKFAAPFYEMHRYRTEAAVRHQFGCLGCSFVVALVLSLPVLLPLAGPDKVMMLPAVGAAILILSVLGNTAAFADMKKARLLPFFEREVGDTDTWMAGEHLLCNSALLEEMAVSNGIPPLSAFLSGDPLIQGEQGRMFESADGLEAIEKLLELARESGLEKGILSDLRKLKNALKRASEQEIRFCLHLREGNGASGAEMDLRKGSYF